MRTEITESFFYGAENEEKKKWDFANLYLFWAGPLFMMYKVAFGSNQIDSIFSFNVKSFFCQQLSPIYKCKGV